MNHCKLIVTALALIGVLHTGNARAEIKTEVVEYNQGDTALEGFLAYDDAVQGKRPAILVAHTWTGVSDFIRTRSTELAKMGYVVFAPDIYGKGVRPKPPVETRQEMGKYTGNRPLLRSRVQAGLDVLRANPMTDTGKVLAIGFCFGGTTVLELARTGADVSAWSASMAGRLTARRRTTPGTSRVACSCCTVPTIPTSQRRR